MIEKGSIIWVDGWWFVVVEEKDNYLHCICDNANNVYSWEKEDIQLIISPKNAVLIDMYRFYHPSSICSDISEKEEDFFIKHCQKREIPIHVIAEVLVGLHDERWN